MKVLDLVACSMKLYEKYTEPICRSFGLTAAELNILLFLANNPEYDSAGSIVEKRHLAKSHVSVSVRGLEERGLVRREYRMGDRRTAHLVLLPSSDEIVASGQRAQEAFMDTLTEGLTDEEIGRMKKYLDKMGDNAVRGLREG